LQAKPFPLLPLIEPDVRFSRIRLSCKRSIINVPNPSFRGSDRDSSLSVERTFTDSFDSDGEPFAPVHSGLYLGGLSESNHIGAFRNNNRRLFNQLGPDTGFDSIGDYRQGPGLVRLLDRLDSTNQLAKTILYNINPADNELMATMIGNDQDGTCPGKIQFGSGWWFLDQKDGMERQMNALSNLGLLSRFIGMLTDSRSFLSYPRHEYFRRILCNLIGTDVENGEIPADMELLGSMVENICYTNAAEYFGIEL